MIFAERASSSRRTSCRLSRTSGRSMAGLRMSPSSPPVQHTSTVRTPWSLYLATVPAPLDASSSGCAWTVSKQSGSAMRQRYRSRPRAQRARWDQAPPGSADGVTNAVRVPWPSAGRTGSTVEGQQVVAAALLVEQEAPAEHLGEHLPALVGTAGDELVASVQPHRTPGPVEVAATTTHREHGEARLDVDLQLAERRIVGARGLGHPDAHDGLVGLAE